MVQVNLEEIEEEMEQYQNQQERKSRVEGIGPQIRDLDRDIGRGLINREQYEKERKLYEEKLQSALSLIIVHVVWVGYAGDIAKESHKVRGRWEIYHLINELAQHCEGQGRAYYVMKGQALIYEKFPFAEEHERVVAVVNW